MVIYNKQFACIFCQQLSIILLLTLNVYFFLYLTNESWGFDIKNKEKKSLHRVQFSVRKMLWKIRSTLDHHPHSQSNYIMACFETIQLTNKES